jgi:hypothetical protein
MTVRPFVCTAAAASVLAVALAAAAPAHAASIMAVAQSASSQPTPVAGTENLQNGDFLILANNALAMTGDGRDEATRWAFDFTGDPGYAAFVAAGVVTEARLTLTLNTELFGQDGLGPLTDLTYPSDTTGAAVFPAWIIQPFIQKQGTYTMGTATANLVSGIGMSGSDLFGWLQQHGGLFPMIYADDAILVRAELTLESPSVPEPGLAALLVAGFAATLRRARRPRV